MSRKTPKSILNELLMMNLCSNPPVFATSKIGGLDHMPIYESTVTIIGWQMGISKTIPTVAGRGQGNSKKQAEHAAAVKALLELKKLDVLVWPSMYITPKLRLYPSFHPVPQPGQQNQSENALVLQAAQVRGNSTAEYYGHNRAHDIGVY